MDLRKFQVEASTQVADRFAAYMKEPLPRLNNTIVPFYQNIVALTGSGKTLILADVIEQARFHLPRGLQPIVFWISKGRVVVGQTYQNLTSGKYSSLVSGYDVKPLLDCRPSDITDASRGLLLIATAAKFNRAEREDSDLRVFSLSEDWSKEPLWDLLKRRRADDGTKRHLIVVYDEGHNLSDQQTQLLFELDPDALICATATPEYPKQLSQTIARLLDEKHYSVADLNTIVSTSAVVNSGLIKKQIMLGGYVTPMEVAINDMLEEMRQAERATSELGLPFRPKAIYVSETNTIDGVSVKEDAERPFNQRKARPILIWRHLVENCGIDPADIAVYLDLKFDRSQRPPENFILFKPGEADYAAFSAGNFHHIIFNLSLQEGWDDPAAGFAYVDKSMGSTRQIAQLIGRLLRQPGAQHYSEPSLNIAHWFIRTDEKSVFKEILDDIRSKLGRDIPAEVSLTFRETRKSGQKHVLEPRKERTVPTPSVYSKDAQPKIKAVEQSIIDFRTPSESTVGVGNRIRVLQTVGSDQGSVEEWKASTHSNLVIARWIFRRELARGHSKAEGLCDIDHPRLDAMIEYTSPAANHLREKANEVVDAYLEYSRIVQNANDHPYRIGSVAYDEHSFVKFQNALHEGYSGMNGFERRFAEALDKTRRVWCRNPSMSGFGIPLLDRGETQTFRPDFLVWADKSVVAIDTKGDHLITRDAVRKLFFIEQIEDGPDLVIRLVTEGKWESHGGIPTRVKESDGYSVWALKQGKPTPIYCEDASEAAQQCFLVAAARF